MNTCGCHRHYLLGGKARCLHKLFEANVVKAVVRETTHYSVEFWIYADPVTKIKRGRYAGRYSLNGSRSRLLTRDQILLAIALAEQYNVKKVKT